MPISASRAGKLDQPRRVIARSRSASGRLLPRVGFIVTDLSRRSTGCRLYNKRGACEQWIQRRKRRDQVDAAIVPNARCQRGSISIRCAVLQSRQFPAHAGDARTDQGLVADELEGEADQDRRKGGEPWTLRCLSDGGGRHPTASVPGDFAAHWGTTAAATTSTSIDARWSCTQEQPTGGVRRNASENEQISPHDHRSGCASCR